MELSEEQIRYSRELAKFPMKFCLPCLFGNPSSASVKVNSGTATLVRYRDEKYAITNFHVIEMFRERYQEEENIQLYIGNARINLDEVLLDEDKDLDLCILYLECNDDRRFFQHGEIESHFFHAIEFNLAGVKNGDFVILGGYPGIWRQRNNVNELIYDSFSSGGTEVAELTDRSMRCELAMERCVTTMKGQERKGPPEEYGGLSGGPVFYKSVNAGGIEVFDLVGIIYEYIEQYDSLLVRPIHFIGDDFCIKRN